MPTWIWLTILAIGVFGVGALVWWSSGRSPLRKGAAELTADQRLETDRHRLDTALRPGTGANPNNLGGR